MSQPANQALLDLELAAFEAAAEAMQRGMHVDDVAQTLTLLATKIQFTGRFHRKVTGKDLSHLP